MTNELKELLMSKGLTKQQVNSVTVEVCVNALMPNDCAALIAESARQVKEMRDMVFGLRKEYMTLADSILEIQKAQTEFGSITDERGKNALSLYASIMAMNEKSKVPPELSAESAGYILYAYLGGQAKRELTFADYEVHTPKAGRN